VWPVSFLLVHHARISKSVDESGLTLNIGIRDVADLLTRKKIPCCADTSLRKCDDVSIVDEVDKSITYVALMLEIYSQV
jgi:hypothetical protein